jgi:hypothetical protein
MRMKCQVNVLAMATLAVASTINPPVGAKEALAIRVSPAVSFAPASLVIRTTIEPDPYNRAVEIVADSEQFYRSSLVQLDGERAARTRNLEFRSLPPGEYEVKATLIGLDGHERALARTHVNVVESGTSR